MRAISSLFGLLLFLAGTAGVFVLSGGPLSILLKPAPLLAAIIAPMGCALVAFGGKDFWVALKAVRFLFIEPLPEEVSAKSIPVARFLIVSTYAVSVLLFLLQLSIAIAQIGGSAAELGQHGFTALFTLAYALFIYEGVWRPLRSRLEGLAE